MSEKTLVQLDEEISTIKERLSAQISELVEVIVNDLPGYALKNIRRAFIEDVEFAESKSDAELTEFKARISAFGQQLSSEIRASLLENLEDWWGQDVALDNAGKTLNGNAKIWAKLDVINVRLSEFMAKENLKASDIHYTTPARFIEGKYPPGMIEKYWSQLGILRAAEAERAELDLEARKARLAQRWDSL